MTESLHSTSIASVRGSRVFIATRMVTLSHLSRNKYSRFLGCSLTILIGRNLERVQNKVFDGKHLFTLACPSLVAESCTTMDAASGGRYTLDMLRRGCTYWLFHQRTPSTCGNAFPSRPQRNGPRHVEYRAFRRCIHDPGPRPIPRSRAMQ